MWVDQMTDLMLFLQYIDTSLPTTKKMSIFFKFLKKWSFWTRTKSCRHLWRMYSFPVSIIFYYRIWYSQCYDSPSAIVWYYFYTYQYKINNKIKKTKCACVTEYPWQRSLYQHCFKCAHCVCQSLNWWARKVKDLEISHLLLHPLIPLILIQSTVNGTRVWKNSLALLI